MDHKDQLKSMLQNIINGKEEDAAVIAHEYLVAKTRDIAGLGGQPDASTEVEDAAQE